ncbi:MAG: TetR/AcrR family transcriptional regulator [Solirubrobacterales bacterium]|nr:TetR/AcrR family transcriptional regulator [Solirubrobacterales bacterium]
MEFTATRPAPTRPRRRTQKERSELTRTALLDAAIAVLVEEGYASASTGRISERAGMSRGAHLHHFRTRDGLISAALEHLALQMIAPHTQPPQSDAPDDLRGLETLWELYTGSLFVAVVDIMAASRTDPELRASLEPLERMVSAHTHALARSLFPAHVGRPGFEDLMIFVLSAVRGVAVLDVTNPGSRHRTKRWHAVRAGLLDVLARARDRGTICRTS